MPYKSVNNEQKIYYLDENHQSEKIVLLLHGLGANSSSWSLQITDLVTSGFRVIAPDVPGFGQSPPSKRGQTPPIIATAIIELLKILGIRKTSVVGISMGGVLALQMVLDYPEYISNLVLVNSFSNHKITDIRVLPYILVRAILIHTLGLDRQAHVVANRIFPQSGQEVFRTQLIDQINKADLGAYRASMRALARFNVTDRLGEINAPTLVITGEQDTTVSPEIQKTMVEKIPNAIQVKINSGHAVSVEQPIQFNQILIKYLLADK